VAEKSIEGGISVETYKKYLDNMSVEKIKERENGGHNKPSMMQSARLTRMPGMTKSTLPIKFFEKLREKKPNVRKASLEKTPKSLGKG
jgi:hypothetical protein